MAKITFIEHNGTKHTVDAPNGSSVMQAATNNLIPGIDADCGGQCSCATCHVIVSDQWTKVVGPPHEKEKLMLDMNPEYNPNSRLSCQIQVTDALDGLVINLPQFQM